ncbi:MAG TPA: histone deacetylase [Vicinamibacterales bacterium]|nr:histone deacetylase [Vicinamibacterales bacterium]
MRCFYSDTFVLPLPAGHRFPMAKYSGLRERILRDEIVAPDDLHEAPRASWDDLRLVHTDEYLTAIEQGTLPREMQRRIGFPWSPQMVERARRSVGATIAAARAALDEGVAANLAGGTHHAFADRGEGYCVFNDVAVAARVVQRDYGKTRIAVVDCDVHQGDGTAAIFRDDGSVFTLSLHGARNYPFRKQTSDLDVELDDGTGDEPYLSRLAHCLDVVFDFNPEVVFYLAGADPYEGDRLGRLKLTIPGLQRRDMLVFNGCREAAVPVVITMSGGYAENLEAIVTIHANTISAAQAAAPAPEALQAPEAPEAPELGTLCHSAFASSPKTTSSPCSRCPS